jgi:hypothetical protein
MSGETGDEAAGTVERTALPTAEPTLPSIRMRLLTIAAIAESEKTAPMLAIARAALMDAARLAEKEEGRAPDGKPELTLEDMLEEREARLRARAAGVHRDA